MLCFWLYVYCILYIIYRYTLTVTWYHWHCTTGMTHLKIKHMFSKSYTFDTAWERNVKGAGIGSWNWSLFPKYSLKFYFTIQPFIGYRNILRACELLKSRYISLHKIGTVTKTSLSPAFCLGRVSRNCHKQTSEGAEKPVSQTFFNCESQWFVFYCHSGGKDLLVESWITRRRVMGFSNSS
jgi:hypothetical protein